MLRSTFLVTAIAATALSAAPATAATRSSLTGLSLPHDTVAPLIQWVEHGVVPERITATKFNADDPTKGVAMTRSLCPFPQFAEHEGKGSTTDAANFVCRAHDDRNHDGHDRDDD